MGNKQFQHTQEREGAQYWKDTECWQVSLNIGPHIDNKEQCINNNLTIYVVYFLDLIIFHHFLIIKALLHS